MNIKLKWILFVQSIFILILLGVLVKTYFNARLEPAQDSNLANSTQLLSPRIYSGILKPKSLLIVNFDPLREVLNDYIRKKNANISVYVVNIRDGASFGIDEKRAYFPASLNKLPVAMLIMRKIEDDELSFDTMLEIEDSDRTDSFGTLYKIKEKELPLRVILEKALKESDNTAFNMLLRQIDQKDLQFLVKYLDYYSKDKIIEDKNISKRSNEFVSAKSMYNVFSSLYLSTFLEQEHSEYILSLLTGTIFDIKKLANLPDNVLIAQKFGSEYYNNTKYFHSCGIMYIDRSRIFYCIMTQGMEQENAIKTVGFIVNTIYRYVSQIRSELDAYKEIGLH